LKVEIGAEASKIKHRKHRGETQTPKTVKEQAPAAPRTTRAEDAQGTPTQRALVLCGPSGVGKGTIIGCLKEGTVRLGLV